MQDIRSVLIFLAALLIQPGLTVASHAQISDLEADVLAAVEQFGDAYRTADVRRLQSRLAANYVHINGGSGNRINRDQWLSWVESQRELLESGDLRIDTYEITDTHLEFFGETAVVTGIVMSSGIREGNPFRVRVRFSNVWIKQDNKWLRAAFHDSPMPASDE